MTKKINLKKILSKYPTFTSEGGYGEYYVIEAMKEACQEILRLAAENASVDKIRLGIFYAEYAFAVNKQSILDTINQIE